MPCGWLSGKRSGECKGLGQKYVWYTQEITFRSVWLELSEQGEENRDLGGDGSDVGGPTEATVGTLARMR